MFKRLGCFTFFTKIYKACIDICIIYVLHLEDNRGVGV